MLTWMLLPANLLCAPPSAAIHRALFLFFIPSIIFALLLQPRRFRNSDPGSHSRHCALPRYYGARIHFYGEKSSAFSSLVDSRRIVHTHAGKRYLLVIFCARKSSLSGFELTQST